LTSHVFILLLYFTKQEPIKIIHFNSANPVCHAFDSEAKDGHDLLVGLNSGDVYSASLRQQLQDVGKKLVGALHYNKDGSINGSRCNAVAWVPNAEGLFVAGHADGNVYVYDKVSGMKISMLSGESFVCPWFAFLFLVVHYIILLGFFSK
jgi:WD40 repeat protein